MSWRPLLEFRDVSVPKLHNLRRAAEAKLRVPPTVWLAANDASTTTPMPHELGPTPWILRSGSPTEDTHTTSNAGQLLSLVVREPSEFFDSLRRVVEAMPTDANGKRLGVVFAQPWLRAHEAGVAFCDGFYYERTAACGGNEGLTSGQERGEVQRGTLGDRDAWVDWLTKVYTAFARDKRIDIEFAHDAQGYVLLQSRPALFPVRRNPLLSLTNHKEILGDPPSPWIVSVMVEAGRDLSFMAIPDPAINKWDEQYAVEVGARGWMNLSFWFRWMDHFGMPRSTVTKNFGGLAMPGDSKLNWRRFVPSIPKLFRFQFACLKTVPQLPRRFRELDRTIAKASSLADLHSAMVAGLSLALRANFSLNAMLAGVLPIRRLFRIRGEGKVVTRDMMEEHRRLATLPVDQRPAALDEWLKRFGHRGPLESDPMRPRFAELRDVLLNDLIQTPHAPAEPPTRDSWWSRLTRPFFQLEERREWFRDSLMKRWQILRAKIQLEANRLIEVCELDRIDDVFFLRGDDLKSARPMRESAAINRAHYEAMRKVDLPITATRDELERLISGTETARLVASGQCVFPGIALSPAVFEGKVRKADELMTLLAKGGLTPDTVLVVPTLEPSWAVVFSRVGGVIAEVGGELSHASILLREARKPALVNCTGIYRQVKTGDRLRIDGAKGIATISED